MRCDKTSICGFLTEVGRAAVNALLVIGLHDPDKEVADQLYLIEFRLLKPLTTCQNQARLNTAATLVHRCWEG